ncbi:hypothetical protein K438DRAFT_1964588 [Mycena galopus ATCC 62051]|nr:hypothetical protein K438DRAFT_1964588 [Mycena galopus ATCC 62051]
MAVEVISLRAIPPPCPQNAPSPPSTLRSSSPASQSAISPSPSSSSPSSPSPSSPNTPAVPPRTTANQPISPERFALWCEASKQKLQSLPKGTQGVVAVVGDGLSLTARLTVYQALGNVDVRFHFGEGAGAGVSRKGFHEFIASNPVSNLTRFFKNLIPSSQRNHSVFERTVHLKTLLDPISFEDRNKVVHDITFADMDDFLTTLRYSERGPEAAVYEMVCAAITGVPYSDG